MKHPLMIVYWTNKARSCSPSLVQMLFQLWGVEMKIIQYYCHWFAYLNLSRHRCCEDFEVIWNSLLCVESEMDMRKFCLLIYQAKKILHILDSYTYIHHETYYRSAVKRKSVQDVWHQNTWQNVNSSHSTSVLSRYHIFVPFRIRILRLIWIVIPIWRL